MFQGLKGGYRRDHAELRRMRERFSGTGKGHTYEKLGESPTQWVGGRTPRLAFTRMDLCWSATTPKGRGKAAADMGERAMEQLGSMSVDASGTA
eukprot:15443816-Alexandrium_andersonii.AAC.1